MSNTIFDSRGLEFRFLQKGKEKPIYVIYAKDEKQALIKLRTYLERSGVHHIYKDMELLK